MQIQNVISGRIFLPLAIGYVWTYAQTISAIRENFVLKKFFFHRTAVDDYLEQMDQPDIFAVSTYVWNWEISKQVAQAVKQKWPQCKIIFGGPHVPYSAEFQKELPFVDCVITYEGEEQFAEYLLSQISPELSENVPIAGLLTAQTKNFVKRSSKVDLTKIPSPYLSGFFDPLFENPEEHNFNMVLETNRGCPYSCSFCDMQDEYYTRVKQFDLERVKQEIDWAAKNKIHFIECADSNFGFFKRDLEITEHLVKVKLATGYPKNFNFTSAKNQPQRVEEIQSLLFDHGIDRGISVSLQSFNPETLKAIKRWNEEPDSLEKKLTFYKQNNVASYVELILGLPQESKTSWAAGLANVIDHSYDTSLLIHPLSIVPNTPFSEPKYIEEHGLRYTTTRSPAQGFCFGTESPEERETICYASSTMPEADWVDSYFYGKSLVGAMYFHGLSYYICEFLKREYGVLPSQFFSRLLEYCKTSRGFFASEYKESTDLLRESLFDLRPWGRKIAGATEMYWSDQAATAMMAMRERDAFFSDLKFFIHTWLPQTQNDARLDDVMIYNLNVLEQPESDVRKQEFQYHWLDYFRGQQSLSKQTSVYTFRGRKWKDAADHALHVYWYGRKSRRCFVKGMDHEFV